MAIEYRTARWPENEMVRETDKAEAMNRLREFIGDANDRGRMRMKGREYTDRFRVRPVLLDRVEDRLQRIPFAEVIIVQREAGDRDQLSIRKLHPDPPLADLNANPLLEAAHAAVWTEFKGDVRSGGAWLCRYIDGTHTVSRHGFWKPDPGGWKGSAEDVFVTEGGMPRQEAMANFVVKEFGNKGLIECISNTRIWTPGSGWHSYGGHQHFHMHMGFAGGAACRP